MVAGMTPESVLISKVGLMIAMKPRFSGTDVMTLHAQRPPGAQLVSTTSEEAVSIQYEKTVIVPRPEGHRCCDRGQANARPRHPHRPAAGATTASSRVGLTASEPLAFAYAASMSGPACPA